MSEFLQIPMVASTVERELKRPRKTERNSCVIAKRRSSMLQTSIESYQEERRLLWERLIRLAALLATGLFLAILTSIVVFSAVNTAYAASTLTARQRII